MKRKGLTFMEVMISLAILSFLSIIVATAVGNNSLLFRKSASHSKAVLATQEKMEKEIDTSRKIDGTKTVNLDIFGGKPIPVKYNTVEFQSDIGGKLVAWIPKDTSSRSSSPQLSMNVVPDIYYLDRNKNKRSNSYIYDEMTIGASYFDNPETRDELLLTQIEWYVAVDDFNIPMVGIDDRDYESIVSDNINLFPKFPDDYTIVKNQTIHKYSTQIREVEFNLEENHRGRHVILAATPGARSGKIGIRANTKPMYISHMPSRLKNKFMKYTNYNYEYVDDFNRNKNILTPVDMDIYKGIVKRTPRHEILNQIGSKNRAIIYFIDEVNDKKYIADIEKVNNDTLKDFDELSVVEMIIYDKSKISDVEKNEVINILQKKYKIK